jgi:RimJ/RimL family protein N-acetyltransferase
MAMIEPTEVTLKDGRRVRLRAATAGDGRPVNRFIREGFLTQEYLIRLPEEYLVTPWQERKRLRQRLQASDELTLIAEAESAIIALLITTTDKRRRARHNCEFGITVTGGWQGSGLGRRMIETLIRWAESVATLERLELRVVVDNVPAIGLYESLGFTVEGRRLGAIKYEDGRVMDDQLMCRRVGGSSRTETSA